MQMRRQNEECIACTLPMTGVAFPFSAARPRLQLYAHCYRQNREGTLTLKAHVLISPSILRGTSKSLARIVCLMPGMRRDTMSLPTRLFLPVKRVESARTGVVVIALLNATSCCLNGVCLSVTKCQRSGSVRARADGRNS